MSIDTFFRRNKKAIKDLFSGTMDHITDSDVEVDATDCGHKQTAFEHFVEWLYTNFVQRPIASDSESASYEEPSEEESTASELTETETSNSSMVLGSDAPSDIGERDPDDSFDDALERGDYDCDSDEGFFDDDNSDEGTASSEDVDGAIDEEETSDDKAFIVEDIE